MGEEWKQIDHYLEKGREGWERDKKRGVERRRDREIEKQAKR